MAGWGRRRVLIAVRTYPVPATKSIEASCTAGISDDGQWVRLFPVPFRLMDEEKRFSKWQWIDADMMKATNDARPESYKLNIDKISVGDKVGTANYWGDRWNSVRPLIRPSLCHIQQERNTNNFPTLGLFKPKRIKRLVLEKETADWTQAELDKLSQDGLFHKAPKYVLEKLPFKFKYEFECDGECNGHSMSCTDWEMAQAYRSWRREYGDGWESAFRRKFERDMIEKFDTHFFVGTIHQHPKNWIIVGLFYPPKTPPKTPDLFDQLN